MTPVARSLFRKDFGHRDISITGNTIIAEGTERHGISVGSGDDIVCAANVLRRADIFDRTGNVEILGQPGTEVVSSGAQPGKIKVIPLSQEWRFARDTEDVGVTKQWFEPHLDDSEWNVVRSDLGGVGWEKQGFAGDDGTGYVGYAWYRAALPELPVGDRPKYVYLHFGLADEQAWVYLNGQPLGEHTEASESKSMDALWDEPFGPAGPRPPCRTCWRRSPSLYLRPGWGSLAGLPASLLLTSKPASFAGLFTIELSAPGLSPPSD